MILIEEEMEGKPHPILKSEGEADSMEIEEGAGAEHVGKRKKILSASKKEEKKTKDH